jgi:hypothetical protein
MGRSMARSTRSGTLVGPGTNRKLRPDIKRVLKKRGKNKARTAKVFGDPCLATPRMGRAPPA